MQRLRTSKYAFLFLAVVSLLSASLLIKGLISQMPWTSAGNMTSPRSGAATVMLQDGPQHAGIGLPDPRGFVAAAGEDQAACKCDSLHLVVVRQQGQLFSRLRAPDAC